MLLKQLGPTVSELNCRLKGQSGAPDGIMRSWERHLALRVSLFNQEYKLIPVNRFREFASHPSEETTLEVLTCSGG